MTTKDEFVPLKKKSILQNVGGQNQFSNFNLNQSRKCLNASLVQSDSKLFRKYRRTGASLKIDSRIVNDKKRLWNKSSSNILHSKLSKSFTSFDEVEATVKTKRRKNDSSDATTSRISTLFLHIAAYENSVEAGDTVSLDKNEGLQKNLIQGQNQKLINFALNPFEFPRQQTDDKTEPAVMQFRTSQQLLNPNQLGSSNDNQQGTQNAAGVRPALVHVNPPPAAQIFGTEMFKYAVAAGICASLAPIFMKLAFTENILSMLKYTYFIGFALSNIFMWFFHSKAMQASDSTIKAVVLNTGTNFIATGILGWLIFGEQQTILWAFGISLIIAGISLIASDKPQIKIE